MFFLPGIYLISGLYTFSISLNCDTWSVFEILDVIYLWSTNSFNFLLNKTVQNSFRDSTILDS